MDIKKIEEFAEYIERQAAKKFAETDDRYFELDLSSFSLDLDNHDDLVTEIEEELISDYEYIGNNKFQSELTDMQLDGLDGDGF